MPDEFYGDETLLISHETPAFSFLAMSEKLMRFNAMKLSMKLLLRLALCILNFSGLEGVPSIWKDMLHELCWLQEKI